MVVKEVLNHLYYTQSQENCQTGMLALDYRQEAVETTKKPQKGRANSDK